MKKLMIVVAAVAVAGMTQAAAISWSSANLTQAKDATGAFGGTSFQSGKVEFTAHIFYLSDVSAYATLDGSGKVTAVDSAAVYDAYKSGTFDSATLKFSGSNKSTMGGTMEIFANSISLTDNTTTTAGKYYAAIIYEYTDKQYGDMYIANVASADYGGATQVPVNNLGTTFGGSTGAGEAITGWTQAVPEPTSGLLLLLGVAGLALRRRRA